MNSWNKAGYAAAVASLSLASCGYHIAGKASLVPKDIHTIAIPPFTNATVKYKLTDSLAEALSREFITRTRYKVVNDATQADAVLRGGVINYVAYPITIDQTTGRTSGLQIILVLNVSLTERASGKVIFSRPRYEEHERYELSTTNDTQYFDESGAAIQRLSGDVARDLVTSILDNF
ncbi:MAG TPA: LptE family protein [Bryobacteraceae bacterium]|nr:LptE family protein [Bryobacteraceae bacterium]